MKARHARYLLPLLLGCVGSPGVGRAVMATATTPPAPDTAATPLPPYPATMLAAAISGRVRLEFPVLASGDVDTAGARVLSATHRYFMVGLPGALAGWRFSPARRAGQPVGATYTVELVFRTSMCPDNRPSPPRGRWAFDSLPPQLVIEQCSVAPPCDHCRRDASVGHPSN